VSDPYEKCENYTIITFRMDRVGKPCFDCNRNLPRILGIEGTEYEKCKCKEENVND
jgi:hypothetical protein